LDLAASSSSFDRLRMRTIRKSRRWKNLILSLSKDEVFATAVEHRIDRVW